MRLGVRLWCAVLVIPASFGVGVHYGPGWAILFLAVGWTLGALVDKCLCYQAPAWDPQRDPVLVAFTGEPNPRVLPRPGQVSRVRGGDVERVRKLRALADDPRTPGPERVNARDKIRRIEDMRS